MMMSESFDPYYQWLGIAPKHQPPNHYRLLGIERFESNDDVIETAADRQLAHVRTFQTGKHIDQCQELLNEIAAAKLCLLDPEQRAQYDAKLKKKRRGTLATAIPLDEGPVTRPLPRGEPLPVAESLSPAPPPQQPPAVAPSVETGPAVPHIHAEASRHVSTRARRKSNLPMVLMAAGGAMAAIALAIVVAVVTWPPPDVANVTDDDANGKKTATRNGDDGDKRTGPDTTDPADDNGTDRPPDDSTNDPAKTGGETPDDTPGGNDTTDPDGDDGPDPGDDSRPDPPPSNRLPVPDAAAQKEAEKEIGDLFDFAAAQSVRDKAELARNLIRTAKDTKDDPAAAFVMYRLAGDMAADAGYVKEAYYAAHEIERRYDVDAFTIRLRYVDRSLRNAEHQQARRDAVEYGIKLVDLGFANDRYEESAELIERIYPVVLRLKEPDLSKALIRRRTASQMLVSQFKAAKEAIETLKTKPDDPAANLAAGKYYAFVRNDFGRGLPMLAKGSDAALAQLANMQLAGAETAATQMKLGDAWWEAGEKADPALREKLRGIAGYWYRKALPGIESSLFRLRIQKRLGEIKSIPESPSGAGKTSAVGSLFTPHFLVLRP